MSLRRLLIGSSMLPAAVLGMMLAMPTQASATVVTYTFSNDASLTFSDGNVEDVSGSFDFNTAGGLVSNADIILTGTGPEAGTYSANPFYDDTVFPAVCASPSGTIPILCTWYTTALGSAPAVSDLMPSPPGGGIGYFATDPGTNITETAATGDIATTPVPEPSTLSLFGAGILSFAGIALYRRRKQSRADLAV
jgi:hypothetical protein